MRSVLKASGLATFLIVAGTTANAQAPSKQYPEPVSPPAPTKTLPAPQAPSKTPPMAVTPVPQVGESTPPTETPMPPPADGKDVPKDLPKPTPPPAGRDVPVDQPPPAGAVPAPQPPAVPAPPPAAVPTPPPAAAPAPAAGAVPTPPATPPPGAASILPGSPSAPRGLASVPVANRFPAGVQRGNNTLHRNQGAASKEALIAYDRGYELYWSGQAAEALTQLRIATASPNAEARAWYYRGLAELALGDQSSASSSIELGAQLHARSEPNARETWRALTRVQGSIRGFIDDALARNRTAIEGMSLARSK
jgi:hypothetical protein